jgi:uncharacterized protein (TIGR03067 family)
MKPWHLFALTIGLVAAPLAGLPAAPGPKDKEKDDLKKFEGDWVVKSWEQRGQAFPNLVDTATWKIKGDKYTLDMQGMVEEGTIKLDAGKKPTAIDLDITAGNDKGKLQVGVYKIDGDTITMCLAWPAAADRPTDFTSTADNGWILITMKRSKKDD